ncbi:uncharacterized protein AB9W97_019544 isoform 2-T2 [Spinachia spinachia]
MLHIEVNKLGIGCEIVTVGEVPVKAGGSISIPCLYKQMYKKHVKYLCEGSPFLFCSIKVETTKKNKNVSSERFSISDDANQGIFTVTINKLTDKDSESHYWCALKINRGLDVKKELQLSVTTTGVPRLYVDQQEISAFDRGSVTVRCYNINPPDSKWCRLNEMCVTGGSGSIDGTAVTINASVSNVFSVTMSGLRTESSGWYFCANENFQMPVRVTVHELPATTATTISSKTGRTSPTTTQHSSLCTSAKSHRAHPTNSTLNGTLGDSLQAHGSTKVVIITTTLILLLFFMTFFGWRTVMKRCNKTKPERSDGTVDLQIGSGPDEHYATIADTQHAAAQHQTKPEGCVTYCSTETKDGASLMTEPLEGSATYSTIVIKRGVGQRTEPAEESVIYSTLQTEGNKPAS